MRRFSSYCTFAAYLLRHIFFRMGLAKSQPSPEGRWEAFQFVVGDFVGWNRYIRVRNTDLVPRGHPAIFYGNHVKLDDPCYLYRAAYLATGGEVGIGAMLRNDFFAGVPFVKSRWFDFDELLETVYVYGISRDTVSVSQLKRFVDLLLSGRGFILYPGRTRSCSGLLMDYRDTAQRPGGISFFLHAVQGRDERIAVSAMPAVRNFNPVTRHTSVIFGPEQVLRRGAARAEQRAFDERLIEVLGPLVELNAAQLVSAVLYTRCVHGLTGALPASDIERIVSEVFDTTAHAYLDPEDTADIARAVHAALRYLARHGMVRVRGRMVHPAADAILRTPPLTAKFRKENPVKFLTNQILHLGDVTAAVEQRVLAPRDPAPRRAFGADRA
jgi:hypothetical protein